MTVSASLPSQPPRRLRVFVVRHGETLENTIGIIQGQLDTPLNAFGQLQASTTADRLSAVRFDRIVTSPLQRARHTAEAICSKQAGVANLQLEQDDRIQERGFGTLEGKPYRAPNKKNDAVIEGIENATELQERLAAFWNELVTVHVPIGSQEQIDSEQQQKQEQNQGQEEQTVLLVSHGAAISSLLNDVLLSGQYIQIPPDVQVSRFGNCCITELVVPTILDHRPLSSIDRPGSFHLKHEWVVKPPQLVGQVGIAQKLQDHGKVTLQDIGVGKGVGSVVRWGDVTHLHGLLQPVEEDGQDQGRGPKVNVDELVSKGAE
jgi:broad specificity phosphatase PhoE